MWINAVTNSESPYVSVHEVDPADLPRGYRYWSDSAAPLVDVGAFYGNIWKSLQLTTNFRYNVYNIERQVILLTSATRW